MPVKGVPTLSALHHCELRQGVRRCLRKHCPFTPHAVPAQALPPWLLLGPRPSISSAVVRVMLGLLGQRSGRCPWLPLALGEPCTVSLLDWIDGGGQGAHCSDSWLCLPHPSTRPLSGCRQCRPRVRLVSWVRPPRLREVSPRWRAAHCAGWSRCQRSRRHRHQAPAWQALSSAMPRLC